MFVYIKEKIGVGVLQSIYVIFGNILATTISAVAIILISRLLGPQKFGEFSIGFAVVLILSRFVDFGFSTAILKIAGRTQEKQLQKEIFSEALFFKIILSIFLAIIGITTYKYLANAIGFQEEKIILIAFTVGLGTIFYEHLLTILQTLHLFKNVVIINIIQAIVKILVLGLFFIFSIQNTYLIFLSYILAPIVPLLFWKFLAPNTISFNFIKNTISFPHFFSFFSIVKHSAVAVIASGIIENIDILFLQKYLTTFEAGLYAGVSKIALVVSLIAYSLSSVLNARVTKYKKKVDIKKYLVKSHIVAFTSLILFLISLLFIDTLILFTVGSDYLAGSNTLVLLLASSFTTIATTPYIALFFSFKINWYFSFSAVLLLIIVLGGNILFVPIFGLNASAWSRLVSKVLLFLITIFISWREYKKLLD